MDALASYISFIDQAGVPVGQNFQNFHMEATRSYEGRSYMWAGFGYSGAVVDIDAANVEATLVFYVTDLMLALAEQAMSQYWLVNVKTVWLDPQTLNETSDRVEEFYAVAGYQHNLTEMTMRLASPLDAQAAELPARVLSQRIVGRLPPTGALQLI